mmetsp:Transcript_147474/g.471589  ORF Transcript_147474/g.471589 Transcript_147474/m.471589 type:complete len:202 (+) Transcript_147474:787-1392(+)
MQIFASGGQEAGVGGPGQAAHAGGASELRDQFEVPFHKQDRNLAGLAANREDLSGGGEGGGVQQVGEVYGRDLRALLPFVGHPKRRPAKQWLSSLCSQCSTSRSSSHACRPTRHTPPRRHRWERSRHFGRRRSAAAGRGSRGRGPTSRGPSWSAIPPPTTPGGLTSWPMKVRRPPPTPKFRPPHTYRCPKRSARTRRCPRP